MIRNPPAPPPAIPALTGATGNGGANSTSAATLANRNPVSAMRAKRAADDRANAAAAASGVTVTHFGPGEKAKKKRHIDDQDRIDQLFAPQATKQSDLTNKVVDLIGSLKGSPRKKKKDREEQLNRLINGYEESAKNKLTLGQPIDKLLKKIEELEAERDAL
jgi:hypothetical protein